VAAAASTTGPGDMAFVLVNKDTHKTNWNRRIEIARNDRFDDETLFVLFILSPFPPHGLSGSSVHNLLGPLLSFLDPYSEFFFKY